MYFRGWLDWTEGGRVRGGVGGGVCVGGIIFDQKGESCGGAAERVPRCPTYAPVSPGIPPYPVFPRYSAGPGGIPLSRHISPRMPRKEVPDQASAVPQLYERFPPSHDGSTRIPRTTLDGVSRESRPYRGRGAWLRVGVSCELSHLCAERRERTDNGERTNTLYRTRHSRDEKRPTHRAPA